MNRLFLAVVLASCTAVAGTGASGEWQPPAGLNSETAELVKGNSAFAVDLYSKLSGEEGNLFFSPYSISTALGMMYGGARGETASEMAKVMHFSQSQETLHRSAGSLIGAINGKSGPRSYQLITANCLWGQQGYGFDPNFVKLLQDNYSAGLKEVDFAKAPEQSRQTINGWVEEQTNQKIKELLTPGKVVPSTRLVLTNAIYFKAAWAQRFAVSSKAPKLGEFKLSATKSVADVPMMSGTFLNGIKTGEAEGVQVVALPYVKNELSMFILLPNEIDGLPALEKKLAERPALLSNLLSRAEPGRAKLTMPKFKVTSEFELSKKLIAMGMKSAFGTPGFSGITTREPIAISFVVHKAFVDVNEEGTEAAAATAVGGKGGGKAPVVPEIRVDHPFLYLIVDNNSGSILFMGRLSNPKA
jgi:serine protease inhibitor